MMRRSQLKIAVALAMFSLVFVAPDARAQDPAPPGAAASPGADAPPVSAAAASNPAQSMRSIRRAQEQLGKITNDARKDSDIPRLNCALDKQAKGEAIAREAQLEVLIIGNSASSEPTRALAVAKLGGFATNIEAVVAAAYLQCTPQVDDDSVDTTKTEAGEDSGPGGVNPSAVAVSAVHELPVFDPVWLPTTSGVQ